MRLPIPILLAAAVVIATTAVLIIIVRPVSPPAVLPPNQTFSITEGSWVPYFYSADKVSVASNVTADFGIASFGMLPVILVRGSLPVNQMVSFQYTDPITGYTYTISLYNASDGTVKIYHNTAFDWPCQWQGNYLPTGVPLTKAKTPYGVVLYPDIDAWGLYAIADDSGITVWNSQYNNWALKCPYSTTYSSATGYSHSVSPAKVTVDLGGNVYVTFVVRPLIGAAVKPSATAKVTIVAS